MMGVRICWGVRGRGRGGMGERRGGRVVWGQRRGWRWVRRPRVGKVLDPWRNPTYLICVHPIGCSFTCDSNQTYASPPMPQLATVSPLILDYN